MVNYFFSTICLTPLFFSSILISFCIVNSTLFRAKNEDIPSVYVTKKSSRQTNQKLRHGYASLKMKTNKTKKVARATPSSKMGVAEPSLFAWGWFWLPSIADFEVAEPLLMTIIGVVPLPT